MSYFPFFTDISQKNALIAGGGKTALRKAEILLSFGARVSVVSPFICSEIEKNQLIKKIPRCFSKDDLNGVFMVVAATNDSKTNALISRLCFEKGIPVNVVDNIELCSFIFPSIVKNGDIVCSISSGGKSPSVTQYIKNELIKILPPYLEDINNRIGALRDKIKSSVPNASLREEIFKDIFSLLITTKNTSSDTDIENIIKKAADKNGEN